MGIIFRKSRNEVNNKIKNAKSSYYYKTFDACDGNSRKTWATINELPRRKSGRTVINELELDGVKISNSAEIADAFNNFFAEIGPNLFNDIEDVDVGFEEFVSHTDHLFSFQRVSHLHIRKYCPI